LSLVAELAKSNEAQHRAFVGLRYANPYNEFINRKRLNRKTWLVLQQHCIDEYRAIQSVQGKAWVAGNGRLWHGATTLGKTHNAVLDALGCSLQASQKAVIHVVALFFVCTVLRLHFFFVCTSYLIILASLIPEFVRKPPKKIIPLEIQ